jgi:hypothetical protein
MRKLLGCLTLAVVLGAGVLSVTAVGCGDDSGSTGGSGGSSGHGGTGGSAGSAGTGGSSGTGGGGGMMPDAGCFNNPQSYVEIINACTTAMKVNKTSAIPPGKLLPDGGLPPLP